LGSSGKRAPIPSTAMNSVLLRLSSKAETPRRVVVSAKASTKTVVKQQAGRDIKWAFLAEGKKGKGANDFANIFS
jgi:hypothetical protein